MTRSRLLSLAALAAGVVLVPAAAAHGRDSGASVRKGGTFRIALPHSVFDTIDPHLSRLAAPLFLFRATCTSLLTTPAKPPPAGYRLVPEIAAAQPRISNRGKTYTFTVRRGLRFSNGAPVTPRDVAQTFNRVLDPRLGSPGASALGDVVGAKQVVAGKTRRARGVVVNGRNVVVRLTRPRASFLVDAATLCVLPARLPVNREGVRPPVPTAGPYTITRYLPRQRVVLQRNRFYRGARPGRVDRFVVTLTDDVSVLEQVERGAVDWGWVPNQVIAQRTRELAAKYGVNKGRFFIRRGLFLRLLVLNASRPLFGSARMRRAVNFAIDRRALLRERGFRAGNLTDQYLPPAFPGFRNARVYPLTRPDVARARALARGRTRGRKAVFYAPANPIGAAHGQIVRRSLARIGLDVDVKLFPIALLFDKLATPGEPFDIGWVGWLASPPDPALLNFLFDGRTIGRPGFGNWSYFNSPTYNRRLDRVSRLVGGARYRAYGKVDLDLARNAAPAIAYAYDNAFTVVGRRAGCIVLNPELDLRAVCLKR